MNAKVNTLAFTIEDAAAAASTNPDRIVDACRARELALRRLGTEPIILASELQTWLESLPNWYAVGDEIEGLDP